MSDLLILYAATVIGMTAFIFAPNLLRFRIQVFRSFGWTRLAGWHERHLHTLVIVGRTILAAVIFLLLILSLAGSAA